MIALNSRNIGDLVLSHQECRKVLSDLRTLVQTWDLGNRAGIPALARKASQQIVNSLTHDHLQQITSILGEEVVVDQPDHRLSMNLESTVDELQLCDFGFSNVCLSRDKNKVYLTYWR